MNPPQTPVTILAGFLGSGKTTLLKQLLRTNQQRSDRKRLACLVNDMSKLEVDGELVRMGHAVSEKDDSLVSLFEGSMSEEQLLKVPEAIDQLLRSHPDHILVETSGSSHPWPLLTIISRHPKTAVRHFVALVDATALHHDYDNGEALLHRDNDQESEKLSVKDLLVEQLLFADIVLLTKVDRIQKDLFQLVNVIETLNPRCSILGTAYGKLEPDVLLEGADYPLDQAEQLAHALNLSAPETTRKAADYDLGSDVIRDVRPFHPERLWTLFHTRLGAGIHRSKGFLWLASRPADVLLWNQAGGSFGLEWLGIWKAAALETTPSKLLPEEREYLQTFVAAGHPIFGDRSCELTVIGSERDRKIFSQELLACFCTDEEVNYWRNGGTFPDPWPKIHRRIA